MKKSIMRKWVAALRSGEYVQGKGRLVDDKDRFCCLGVLCNLAVDDGIGEWENEGVENKEWAFKCQFDSQRFAIPDEVQKWAGLKTCVGHLGKGRIFLSRFNDEDGKSFSEIADIIEANWEVL